MPVTKVIAAPPLLPYHQHIKRGHKAWTLAREEEAMSVTTEKTVRELALEKPGAARVFEKLGIDYCCGGKQTLEQACRAASLPMAQVLDALEAEQPSAQAFAKDSNWPAQPLAD